MNVTNIILPLNIVDLSSLHQKSLGVTPWTKLYRLTNVGDRAPTIEWRRYRTLIIEEKPTHYYQIRIPNLPKCKRFHISFLTKRMHECASYEIVRKKTGSMITRDSAFHNPHQYGGIDPSTEEVSYVELTELATGETHLYSCLPRSIQHKLEKITLMLNPLDDFNQEFLCVLSGLNPYEDVSIKLGSNAKMLLSSSEKGEVAFYLDEQNQGKGGEGRLVIRRFLKEKNEIIFTYLWGNRIHQDESLSFVKKTTLGHVLSPI